MCDYSLEVYGSRPAREGEVYVTSRFPSGTIGLVADGAPGTAVCLACDTALRISDIPASLRSEFDLNATEKGVFTRLESGSYRDAIRFENGKDVSLQRFVPGMHVEVMQLLENVPMEHFANDPAAYEGA